MSAAPETVQPTQPPEVPSPTSPLSHPWRLLGLIAVAGLVIETLLHGQPPALGFSVAVAVTLGVMVGVARLRQIRLGPSHWALMAATLFFGGMVGVRASESLKAFNILAVLALLLLIAYLYAQGDRRQLSLGSLLVGTISAAFATVFMPVAFFLNDLPGQRPQISGQSGWVRVGVGMLIALPLLALFSALFASADAVFAQTISDLWRWDLRSLIARLIFTWFIVWLGVGLMRYALTHTLPPLRIDLALSQRRPNLGIVELVTVLALVNLLFLAFVAIQFAYLFGGLDTLAQTGLTFSEYARRGFFELVAVAVLVILLVLAADWLARGHTGPSARWVDGLHALLLALTAIVLVSALQRMRLYVGAFGLTELRFYTTAAMIGIGFTLVWVGVTLLKDRRMAFVPGALLAAIVLFAGVNLINPDATIARYNLTVPTTESSLDVAYLSTQLGDDAIPTLVAYLPTLPKNDQFRLKAALGKRLNWQNAQTRRTWRGMDWGTGRAIRAMVGLMGVAGK